MMRAIGVDCIFTAAGTVRVRRIRSNGRWQRVEQGRQWQDEEGRHILIMLDGTFVREIVLKVTDLRWEMKEATRSDTGKLVA